MTLRSLQKRLVLLDAHAIIHRAYHALPDFTGPDGAPTGALYGLSSMLLRIIDDLEPDYIAACYDLPKPTVRHEAYAAYKGTRNKTDDALVTQLKGSRAVFEAFSIPCYDREGFEADDLLGTIAAAFKDEPHLQVVIASGDLDTLQLVDGERVVVYTLGRGINETITYNEKKVVERFGFTPALVPDWKGLRGDPSDNIKGVPGIGEKTATDLICNFGSVEELYTTLHGKDGEERLAKKGIKPRIINLLKEHEEEARFSRALATIRTDAPIAFSLPVTSWRDGVRLPKILTLFDALGFRSLRPRAHAVLTANGTDPEASELDDFVAEETVDETRLQEAAVMLWLLASDFTNPSKDDILAYAKERRFDAAYAVLEKKIAETGRLKEVYDTIERPLIPVLKTMKEYGVLIDTKALEKLRVVYQKELDALEEKIIAAAGVSFNINSPKQLGEVLFDTLALIPKGQKRTKTGERSTKESELEKIRDLHPIVEDVLSYREIKKLLGTYIESIPPLLDAQGRLHADFIQTGTTTGRFASQNPNLQNIPIRTERGRAIRHAFIAAPGFVIAAFDYSQIELRIAAILSGDEKLIAIFKSGRDVHREVAALVFNVSHDAVDYEMRRRAKIINFGILYGMGVNALKAQLGSSTPEAHQFLEDYFHTFKTLAEYLERTKGSARKHGYTETLFGRRREFPGLTSSLPYVRAQSERMAINAPIQGTQADIIKLAMVQIDQALGATEDAHLLFQVHDELVYELREEKLPELAATIRHIMETALPEKDAAGVPVIAEGKVGKNWGDLAPI